MENSEKKILQKNLMKFLIEDVFNAVSDEDVLQIKGTEWMYKGRPLTESEARTLKEEANIISQMRLWKVMQDEIVWHAQNAIVLKSKGEDDLIAGKMLLYWNDLMKNVIKKIENGHIGPMSQKDS